MSVAKTLTNAINLGAGSVQPVADTFEFDGSKANSYKVLLGANSTVHFSNLQPGAMYALEVQQGAGAPWTVTGTGYTLPASQSFVVLGGVGDVTVFLFMNYRGASIAISSVGSSSNSVTSTDDLTLSSAAGKKVILQEGVIPTLRVDDSDPFAVGVAGCCVDLTGNASGLSYIKAGAICVIQATSQLRFRDPANTTQFQTGTGAVTIGTSGADACTFNSKVGFYGTVPVVQQVLANATGNAGAAVSLVDVTTGGATTDPSAAYTAKINANFAAIWKKLNNYGLWA